jgi:hypothetical protein
MASIVIYTETREDDSIVFTVYDFAGDEFDDGLEFDRLVDAEAEAEDMVYHYGRQGLEVEIVVEN